MQDLLRQEAQREADVQELDEQVPCLFRVLLPVVTVTAWQMDRERINASLQDMGMEASRLQGVTPAAAASISRSG